VPIETPAGYVAHSERTLAGYLGGLAVARARLGGAPADWRISEVGDGNLNLVFIVEGPAGELCVKQALPYVRLVGEGWPLRLERAFFEQAAMAIHGELAPGRVPALLHYEPQLYLIVMERLRPHIVMRGGMIDGQIYPRFAEQIADYMARTLFLTSDMALPAERKKAMIATFCANTELCKITEDLIFTEPYMVHERNRWTSPQLDADARAIREDGPLKAAVSALKLKFLSSAQALIHGDLHTGSIMVTADDTRVIDPEFAFVGPIGFDVGKLIGNLLMSYFSQDGHERRPGERDAYRAWVLETIEAVWQGFERRFLELWAAPHRGDAYPRALFAEPGDLSALEAAKRAHLRALFTDSLGFAGAAMIRRTLGLAHNADFERIADPDRRAGCERRNLRLARRLILEAPTIADISAVTELARQTRAGD
jgi:5-methylthioribose kinase